MCTSKVHMTFCKKGKKTEVKRKRKVLSIMITKIQWDSNNLIERGRDMKIDSQTESENLNSRWFQN